MSQLALNSVSVPPEYDTSSLCPGLIFLSFIHTVAQLGLYIRNLIWVILVKEDVIAGS